MEVFTAGIDLIKTIVTVIGAAMTILGAIQFLQGQSESNAAEKKTGMGLFVSGGGIVLIAQTLIPMLGNMLG